MLRHYPKAQFLLLRQSSSILDPTGTVVALCAEPYSTAKLLNTSSDICTMIASHVCCSVAFELSKKQSCDIAESLST